jgi:ATP/ADP translocase
LLRPAHTIEIFGWVVGAALLPILAAIGRAVLLVLAFNTVSSREAVSELRG